MTVHVASLVIVVSTVLVLSCGQTDTYAVATKVFTHMTVVGMSSDTLTVHVNGEVAGRRNGCDRPCIIHLYL